MESTMNKYVYLLFSCMITSAIVGAAGREGVPSKLNRSSGSRFFGASSPMVVIEEEEVEEPVEPEDSTRVAGNDSGVDGIGTSPASSEVQEAASSAVSPTSAMTRAGKPKRAVSFSQTDTVAYFGVESPF